VLLLCLAPEIDPTFERLYAYVQDDITRKYVTPYLAVSLFQAHGLSKTDLRQGFLPDSPLFRFRLIHRENPSQGPQAGLARPCESTLEWPTISRVTTTSMREWLTSSPPSPAKGVGPVFRGDYSSAQRAFRLGDQIAFPPILNFTGSAVKTKEEVASKICESLGISLYRLKSKRLQGSGLNMQDLAALLERDCMLLPAVLFIDVRDLDRNQDPSGSLLEVLLEKLRVFFFISSEEPWPCDKECFVVAVPKPDTPEQSLLWRRLLERDGGDLEDAVG